MLLMKFINLMWCKLVWNNIFCIYYDIKIYFTILKKKLKENFSCTPPLFWNYIFCWTLIQSYENDIKNIMLCIKVQLSIIPSWMKLSGKHGNMTIVYGLLNLDWVKIRNRLRSIQVWSFISKMIGYKALSFDIR